MTEIISGLNDNWYLGITPEQFTRIYGEAIDMEIFTRPSKSDEEFINRYLTSKLWRLNNLYYIIDKKANSFILPMNYGQHVIYAASLQHPRLIILKSRQWGVSTFWLISFLDDSIFIPDLNVGLMSQGKEESAVLLKRVKISWDRLDEGVKALLGVTHVRDNTGEISFNNGSTIYIGTSFRSATLHRLHISEYGKICNHYPERALETKTGSLQAIQAGNPVVIESTAEGSNDFETMWEQAQLAEIRANRNGGIFAGKDYKPVFLPWLDDPDCVSKISEHVSQEQEKYFTDLEAQLNIKIRKEQKNFWISQERELGFSIKQEYPATPAEAFEKAVEGSYYKAIYNRHIVANNRIVKDLYDPNLEVNVCFDLGINDIFTLIYFQLFDKETRIIEDYQNSNEGLEHYVAHINNSGYDIHWVVCPHDIRVTELGTGKSRETVLRELGVSRLKVLDRLPVNDGIELVRQLLTRLWIDEKCRYTIDCIKNYSKSWDEVNHTWRNKPIHNKWSHGADNLRYIATAGITRREKVMSSRKSSSNFVYDGLAL